MGWVTLTLRKTELKRTHADYQKQLLDISREKWEEAIVQTVPEKFRELNLKAFALGYEFV